MATGLNASAADASFRGTDAPMRLPEHQAHALSHAATLPAGPVNGGEKLLALIARARQGSATAIGQLVENARAFLLLTATRHLPQRLTKKVGASDVVQETAIEVQRGFAGFNGTTEAELFAWMRRILLNNVADAIRHYEGTAKRDVTRERSLDQHESQAAADELPSNKRPPDESVIGREDAAAVAVAMQALDPHYREVLHLRYWEQCSFMEIGIRMNRSPEAARKLWYRAVKQFNDALPSR
jgi:RNA polymerase sigma-70 factor (ECF subfamily)